MLGSRFQLNLTKVILQFSGDEMIYLIDGAGITGNLSGRKFSQFSTSQHLPKSVIHLEFI